MEELETGPRALQGVFYLLKHYPCGNSKNGVHLSRWPPPVADLRPRAASKRLCPSLTRQQGVRASPAHRQELVESRFGSRAAGSKIRALHAASREAQVSQIPLWGGRSLRTEYTQNITLDSMMRKTMTRAHAYRVFSVCQVLFMCHVFIPFILCPTLPNRHCSYAHFTGVQTKALRVK